jgi:hypothetical protein
MKRTFCLAFAGAVLILSAHAHSSGEEVRAVTPLVRAHAHNDYEHSHPLLDALERGFCGVEADIHLVHGALLVGHNADGLQPERTLDHLYLAPLHSLVERNHGRVFPNGPSVTLLIDMKTDGISTYQALKPLLKKYESMLTRFENDRIVTNAVTVIISGNRPRAMLLAESSRLAAFDGRLSDLGKDLPIAFMPLVSDSFKQRFPSLAKTGSLSGEDRQAFQQAIKAAHAEGRRIRFWDTSDTPETWRMLLDAGVDLINTDRLSGLASFLNDAAPPHAKAPQE